MKFRIKYPRLLNTNALDHRYYHRFWTHVMPAGKNDCWLWNRKARTFCAGRAYAVHRYCAMMQLQRFLTYEEHVCHDCPEGDNPMCVNPKHLFIGNGKLNTHDCLIKGRAFFQRSLSPEQIEEIRHLYETTDATQASLASHFHVSQPAISWIVNWKRHRKEVKKLKLPLLHLPEWAV